MDGEARRQGLARVHRQDRPFGAGDPWSPFDPFGKQQEQQQQQQQQAPPQEPPPPPQEPRRRRRRRHRRRPAAPSSPPPAAAAGAAATGAAAAAVGTTADADEAAAATATGAAPPAGGRGGVCRRRPPLLLLPVADLLNHDDLGTAGWLVAPRTGGTARRPRIDEPGSLKLLPRRAVAAGAALTMKYGELGVADTLLRYGCVSIDGSAYDTAEVSTPLAGDGPSPCAFKNYSLQVLGDPARGGATLRAALNARS